MDTQTLTAVLAVFTWAHEAKLSRAAIESLDARLKVLEDDRRKLDEGLLKMREEDRQRSREGEP